MSQAEHPCIVNVADGIWYPKAQARLQRSLSEVQYLGARLVWTNEVPPESPTHQENPYAFKVWAFLEALKHLYDVVLWVDASCWAIKHPQPMFEIIERDGYLLFDNGANLGDWCADDAMRLLGLSREELRAIQMPACTIMGLDLRTEIGRDFLYRWHACARLGVFKGPHKNDNGEASADPTVKGHRHDQIAAGFIAHSMELKLTSPHGLYAYEAYGNWPESTVMLTRGM